MAGYSFLGPEERITGHETNRIPREASRKSGDLKRPVLRMLEQESRGKKTTPQKKSGARYPAGDMDILKTLAEMRQERARIEEAIVVLERLVLGQEKRRGRPPAWMAAASAPKPRGRPTGSTNKPKAKMPDR